MVDDLRYGYDVDRFCNNLDDQFNCSICTNVVRNPMECNKCGSLYCKTCLDQWLQKKQECPRSRCDLAKQPMEPISGALKRIYTNLEIKCKYMQKCGKTIKLGDLLQHEASCQRRMCWNHQLCKEFIQENPNPALLKEGCCGLECLLLKMINNSKKEQLKYLLFDIKAFLNQYNGTDYKPSIQSKQQHQHQYQANKQNRMPSHSILKKSSTQQQGIFSTPQFQIQDKDEASFFNKPFQSFDLFSQIDKIKQNKSNNQNSEQIATNATFEWDSKQIGQYIVLSQNNSHVSMNDTGYVFRSVISNRSFTQGQHYWEIHADQSTENELKVGVCISNNFSMDTAFCDTSIGFAFYGLGQLRSGSNAAGKNYGKRFKNSGVLGVFLDNDNGTLSFALDGESFGIAFQNDDFRNKPVYAAVAILHSAKFLLVTGKAIPKYFQVPINNK